MSPHDPFDALLAASREAGYRAAALRAHVATMPPAPDPADTPSVQRFIREALPGFTIGAARSAAADDATVIEEAGRRYEFASGGGRVSVSEVET